MHLPPNLLQAPNPAKPQARAPSPTLRLRPNRRRHGRQRGYRPGMQPHPAVPRPLAPNACRAHAPKGRRCREALAPALPQSQDRRLAAGHKLVRLDPRVRAQVRGGAVVVRCTDFKCGGHKYEAGS